jgi:hypothetical protein
MRAILALLGLAAIILVIGMSLGMIKLEQTAGATFPTIKLEGGSAPSFKADVGKVSLGTTNTTVEVPTLSTTNKTISIPTIEVEKAGNTAAAQ